MKRFRSPGFWLGTVLVAHGLTAWSAAASAQMPADSSAHPAKPMAMSLPMKRWSATLNGMVAYQSTVAAGIHGSTLGVQSAATLGYAANEAATGGTLTVSDGLHEAHLELVGQFDASQFHLAADMDGSLLLMANSAGLTP